MTSIVKVLDAQIVGDRDLRLIFSDGSAGTRNFCDIVFQSGSMVVPLRDPAQFARVFVEYGVPTWPNGFAVDAVALHQEMSESGLLGHEAA